MRPNETSKILHSKGNHKQDKKTTLRMGENICKQINRQRINLQNIFLKTSYVYTLHKMLKTLRGTADFSPPGLSIV